MSSLQEIQEKGIVGAGGAGFPAHVKLAAKVECLIMNAAECEPLFHKDKEILLNHPKQVLAGLKQAMGLVGAARGVIAI